MNPSLHEPSSALHARVQAFLRESASGGPTRESFDAIACDLARFQASRRTGVERLMAARNLEPLSLVRADQIPAVPTDAFKLRRISCHDALDDEVVFKTSGTTIGARGEHAMRTTATYREGARAWGRRMLFPDVEPLRWVILAQDCATAPESSLAFMLGDFASVSGLGVHWILRDGAVDSDALLAAVDIARRNAEPVIVAGASFAFVHLIDALGGRTLDLPANSRAMQTGGFKGRVREVDGAELRASIASTLGIAPDHVVGEYGMTELGSQAYEGVLRRALRLGDPETPAGVFVPPPWMRVRAVDPVTLAPVERGRAGIARIEDLANVDSAVVVQTADRVREVEHGFELLGREPGAVPRGCSIGIDELLAVPSDGHTGSGA